MTPEQLRDEIAKDDATLEEVQRVAGKYQQPRFQTICMCHGDAATCNLACAGRIEVPVVVDYQRHTVDTDPLNSNGTCAHGVSMKHPCAECGPTGRAWYPDQRSMKRHTVDISGPPPQYVEDESSRCSRRIQKKVTSTMSINN